MRDFCKPFKNNIKFKPIKLKHYEEIILNYKNGTTTVISKNGIEFKEKHKLN